MEKLVEVSEQEVQIDFKLGCKCRTKIHIKSLSKSIPIAFKVQTSAPHKFLVSPPNGLVHPSSSTSFQVILKPQTQLPSSFPKSPSERFLLKTALAPDLEDDGHAVTSWFSSTSRVTSDIKLKVVYVGPFLLHQAIANGDMEAIKKIVKRNKPALDRLSPHERRSLLEATSNPEILQFLIEAGLQHENENGPSSSVQEAEAEFKAKGWNQIHLAAATGQYEMLQRLILRDYAREEGLDCGDRLGRAPLHLAASKGHVWCARVLIEAGADKDAKGGDGRTALFRAAANGEAEMVALLLEMGADPTMADDMHGFTPVDVAREKGHKQVVEILESGELVLTAARRGDLNTLKSLLKICPRVTRFDQYGLTALHSAAIKGHTGAVAMLAEHGMNLECQDCEGHTPLHLAVESGCLETVKALIDRAANVNARSKRGATPLYLATSMGHESISQLLRSRGAGPDCPLSSTSSLSSCSFS